MLPLELRPAHSGRRLIDEAHVFGDLDDYMVWHVDILVGTPAQMQSVIVDSGSSRTAFACTTCGNNCGRHVDAPFDPSLSSTFKWISCDGATGCAMGTCVSSNCTYSVSYMEGSSIRGKFFEDVLHFGHHHRFNRRGRVWMGCHTLETNLFRNQKPSGILGLRGGRDVIDALADGPLEKEIIALCFNTNGGAMTLGGINTTWTPLTAPLQYEPYSTPYHVQLHRVQLVHKHGGGEAMLGVDVNFAGMTFLVDSGTTYTYFSHHHSSSLQRAVANACSSGKCGSAEGRDACFYNVDAEALTFFPILRFFFGSSSFDWLPHNYLYKSGHDKWCFAFRGDPPLTLGASFMRNSLFVFDREAKQIGMAPAVCPLVESRRDVVAAGPAALLPPAGITNITSAARTTTAIEHVTVPTTSVARIRAVTTTVASATSNSSSSAVSDSYMLRFFAVPLAAILLATTHSSRA